MKVTKMYCNSCGEEIPNQTYFYGVLVTCQKGNHTNGLYFSAEEGIGKHNGARFEWCPECFKNNLKYKTVDTKEK